MVREEMREGSDLFSIHAYLPAQASFGFANDMRRQSSGGNCSALLPSCCVAHYKVNSGPVALLVGQPGGHSASHSSNTIDSDSKLSILIGSHAQCPHTCCLTNQAVGFGTDRWQVVFGTDRWQDTVLGANLMLVCRCCFSFPDAFSLGAPSDRSLFCASH